MYRHSVRLGTGAMSIMLFSAAQWRADAQMVCDSHRPSVDGRVRRPVVGLVRALRFSSRLIELSAGCKLQEISRSLLEGQVNWISGVPSGSSVCSLVMG